MVLQDVYYRCFSVDIRVNTSLYLNTLALVTPLTLIPLWDFSALVAARADVFQVVSTIRQI